MLVSNFIAFFSRCAVPRLSQRLPRPTMRPGLGKGSLESAAAPGFVTQCTPARANRPLTAGKRPAPMPNPSISHWPGLGGIEFPNCYRALEKLSLSRGTCTTLRTRQ